MLQLSKVYKQNMKIGNQLPFIALIKYNLKISINNREFS